MLLIGSAIQNVSLEDMEKFFISPPEYDDIRLFNSGKLDLDEEQKIILDLGKNQCAASTHLI